MTRVRTTEDPTGPFIELATRRVQGCDGLLLGAPVVNNRFYEDWGGTIQTVRSVEVVGDRTNTCVTFSDGSESWGNWSRMQFDVLTEGAPC